MKNSFKYSISFRSEWITIFLQFEIVKFVIFNMRASAFNLPVDPFGLFSISLSHFGLPNVLAWSVLMRHYMSKWTYSDSKLTVTSVFIYLYYPIFGILSKGSLSFAIFVIFRTALKMKINKLKILTKRYGVNAHETIKMWTPAITINFNVLYGHFSNLCLFSSTRTKIENSLSKDAVIKKYKAEDLPGYNIPTQFFAVYEWSS